MSKNQDEYPNEWLSCKDTTYQKEERAYQTFFWLQTIKQRLLGFQFQFTSRQSSQKYNCEERFTTKKCFKTMSHLSLPAILYQRPFYCYAVMCLMLTV